MPFFHTFLLLSKLNKLVSAYAFQSRLLCYSTCFEILCLQYFSKSSHRNLLARSLWKFGGDCFYENGAGSLVINHGPIDHRFHVQSWNKNLLDGMSYSKSILASEGSQADLVCRIWSLFDNLLERCSSSCGTIQARKTFCCMWKHHKRLSCFWQDRIKEVCLLILRPYSLKIMRTSIVVPNMTKKGTHNLKQ